MQEKGKKNEKPGISGVQNPERFSNNLENRHSFNKPITFSNLCPHRHHKKSTIQSNVDVRKSQQKGCI